MKFLVAKTRLRARGKPGFAPLGIRYFFSHFSDHLESR